jgi:hypothetical protein
MLRIGPAVIRHDELQWNAKHAMNRVAFATKAHRVATE